MNAFESNIISLYGLSGKKWLQRLPESLAVIEQQFNLKIQAPFTNLSYNYVAAATDHEGNRLIVKCSYPNNDTQYEIDALQFYDGDGAIKLISSDAQNGWLLLEACAPGGSLVEQTHDDIATHNAIHVMQKLWKPVTDKHVFKTVKQWLHGLQHLADSNQKHIPKAIVNSALIISSELIASMGEPVLLHGDLHHHNILSATREPWLAIDPKGVIGEREYEFGALLRNPTQLINSHKDLAQLIQRRIDIISEVTQFDKKRILAWCFVQAVLAASWHIEDGTHGAPLMQRFAEICYQSIRKA